MSSIATALFFFSIFFFYPKTRTTIEELLPISSSSTSILLTFYLIAAEHKLRLGLAIKSFPIQSYSNHVSKSNPIKCAKHGLCILFKSSSCCWVWFSVLYFMCKCNLHMVKAFLFAIWERILHCLLYFLSTHFLFQ